MNESYDTIWQVPPITVEGMLESVRSSEDIMINELISEQYKNLQNLGIDHIKDNGVNDRTLFEFIAYVNYNYLPIINIESILDTPIYTQLIGRFIYKFICMDMINYIIPKTMTKIGIGNPSEFPTLNEDILKEQILHTIKCKIDVLKKLNLETNNNVIYQELLKWVFYIDLIDNDISIFIESYIIPVCISYTVDIISNT